MLSEDDKQITKEEGREWREQSSHLAQNQDTRNKINQRSHGHEEENFNCLYRKCRIQVRKQELEWLIYEHGFILTGITKICLGDLDDWNVGITLCKLSQER